MYNPPFIDPIKLEEFRSIIASIQEEIKTVKASCERIIDRIPTYEATKVAEIVASDISESTVVDDPEKSVNDDGVLHHSMAPVFNEDLAMDTVPVDIDSNESGDGEEILVANHKFSESMVLAAAVNDDIHDVRSTIVYNPQQKTSMSSSNYPVEFSKFTLATHNKGTSNPDKLLSSTNTAKIVDDVVLNVSSKVQSNEVICIDDSGSLIAREYLCFSASLVDILPDHNINLLMVDGIRLVSLLSYVQIKEWPPPGVSHSSDGMNGVIFRRNVLHTIGFNSAELREAVDVLLTWLLYVVKGVWDVQRKKATDPLVRAKMLDYQLKAELDMCLQIGSPEFNDNATFSSGYQYAYSQITRCKRKLALREENQVSTANGDSTIQNIELESSNMLLQPSPCSLKCRGLEESLAATVVSKHQRVSKIIHTSAQFERETEQTKVEALVQFVQLRQVSCPWEPGPYILYGGYLKCSDGYTLFDHEVALHRLGDIFIAQSTDFKVDMSWAYGEKLFDPGIPLCVLVSSQSKVSHQVHISTKVIWNANTYCFDHINCLFMAHSLISPGPSRSDNLIGMSLHELSARFLLHKRDVVRGVLVLLSTRLTPILDLELLCGQLLKVGITEAVKVILDGKISATSVSGVKNWDRHKHIPVILPYIWVGQCHGFSVAGESEVSALKSGLRDTSQGVLGSPTTCFPVPSEAILSAHVFAVTTHNVSIVLILFSAVSSEHNWCLSVFTTEVEVAMISISDTIRYSLHGVIFQLVLDWTLQGRLADILEVHFVEYGRCEFQYYSFGGLLSPVQQCGLYTTFFCYFSRDNLVVDLFSSAEEEKCVRTLLLWIWRKAWTMTSSLDIVPPCCLRNFTRSVIFYICFDPGGYVPLFAFTVVFQEFFDRNLLEYFVDECNNRDTSLGEIQSAAGTINARVHIFLPCWNQAVEELLNMREYYGLLSVSFYPGIIYIGAKHTNQSFLQRMILHLLILTRDTQESTTHLSAQCPNEFRLCFPLNIQWWRSSLISISVQHTVCCHKLAKLFLLLPSPLFSATISKRVLTVMMVSTCAGMLTCFCFSNWLGLNGNTLVAYLWHMAWHFSGIRHSDNLYYFCVSHRSSRTRIF